MSVDSLGVAVIGAGMAGRAHAAGYRSASTVYGSGLPDVRLVAIADVYEPFATETARRFGYQRVEDNWQAIAAAPDIDVVSVVVANHLHREVVEGLLAAGKHVLCEKPFAPTIADAQAMVDAAAAADTQTGVGFTFRRSPAIAGIKERIESGAIGAPVHFNGHYWCDYAADPHGPMSWRYRGGPGSGALADIGSHVIDVGEFLFGPVESVSGAVLATSIGHRNLPLGVVAGHAAGAVSEETAAVENEDLVTFTAQFAGGATGTFSASRIAQGLPNALGFEVFTQGGTATFDLARQSEFTYVDSTELGSTRGFRQVLAGPAQPYLTGGLAMDFPGVNFGQNDLFVFQARAFLEQVAGVDGLPPCPSFAHGLHNLQLMQAVVDSARAGGASTRPQSSGTSSAPPAPLSVGAG